MTDKLYKKLPAVHQTAAIKNFFENTVEQLYSKSNVETLSGYIGRISSQNYNTGDVYISEPTAERTQYSLEAAVSSLDSQTGLNENVVFYEDLINALKSYGVDITKQHRLFEGDYYSFVPPIDVDKFVNYQEYYWDPVGPTAITITGTADNPVDIVQDIQGQTSYTSPNGVTLKTGMKVSFSGAYVIPQSIVGEEFIVEGVGTGISLINTLRNFTVPYRLISADTSCDSANVLSGGGACSNGQTYVADFFSSKSGITYRLEGGGYDWTSVDPDEYHSEPQYMLMNTASSEVSVWSRTNFWHHKSNYADAGDGLPSLSKRARRPIIQFDQDLELWQSGECSIAAVEFSAGGAQINDLQARQLPVFVDGNELAKNSTIVFPNDESADALKIHSVDYVSTASIPNGIGSVSVTTGVHPDLPAGNTFNVSGSTSTGSEQLFNVNVDAGGNVSVTVVDPGRQFAANTRIRISSTELGNPAARDVVLNVDTVQSTYTVSGRIGSIASYVNRTDSNRPAGVYKNISGTSSGSGTGQVFTVRIDDSGTADVTIVSGGSGHSDGDIITIADSDLGSGGGAALQLNVNLAFFTLLTPVADKSNPAGAVYGDSDFVPLTAQAGDLVSVRFGEVLGGTEYYVDENSEWRISQPKTRSNQDPLFQLYDNDGVALADDVVYPDSDFAGSAVFAYRTGDSGVEDTVLGRVLSFDTNRNISEVVFTNLLSSETFSYTPAGGSTTENISGYYYVKQRTGQGEQYRTSWVPSETVLTQPVTHALFVQQADVDSNRTTWPIAAKPKSGVQDITVTVNGEAATVEYLADTTSIRFVDKEFSKGDLIEISVITSTGITNGEVSPGRYSVPDSWCVNCVKSDITDVSESDFLGHFSEMISGQQGFQGDALGSNNFKDTAKSTTFARSGIQSADDLTFAALLLGNDQWNPVEALRFCNTEYVKFKNRLKKACTEYVNNNDTTDWDVSDVLEEILREVSTLSVGKNVFDNTYMVGFGDNHAEETITIVNTGITDYVLNTSVDVDAPENSVLVYQVRNGVKTMLCVDVDYTYTTTNGVTEISLTPEKTWLVTDQLLVRIYTSNRESAQVPPTPSAKGLYPAHVPAVITDSTFRTPISVIQGHDGSRTPVTGTGVDDLLLEFEIRVYNSISNAHRSSVAHPELSVYDVRPGFFRDTGYEHRDWYDLLRNSFSQYVMRNKLDFVTNEFFSDSDEFTWNYYSDDTSMPGHWKGLYEYWYDTQTPHLTPWEMLGFVEQPSWWTSTYGTDFSSGNTEMWSDIEQGIIRSGDRENFTDSSYLTRNPYRRLGLSSVLPVGADGVLKSPANITTTDSTVFTGGWQNTQSVASEFSADTDGLTVTRWTQSGSTYLQVNNLTASNNQFTIKTLTSSYPGSASNGALPTNAIGITVNGDAILNPASTDSWNSEGNWRYDRVFNDTVGDSVVAPSADILDQNQWNPAQHSAQIGWAFDGLPIYGPYVYSDPNNASSGIVRATSSYRIKSGNRATAPGGAHTGQFVEDWEYVPGLGMLDQYNVRYAVTPDSPTTKKFFYVVTINSDGTPAYPYAVGPTYRYTPYNAAQNTVGTSVYAGGGTITVLQSSEYVTSYTSDSSKIDSSWKFGDGAPVEYAWKLSEGYPFAVSEALLLSKPGKWVTVFAAPDRITKAVADSDQLIDATTGKRLQQASVPLQGDRTSSNQLVIANGFSQFIYSYITFYGADPETAFVEPYRNVRTELAHKFAGFVDGDTLNVFSDSYSPDGTSTGLLLPKEDVQISLHASPYTSVNDYSGVQIELTQDRKYRISGFNSVNNYFTILPVDTRAARNQVQVGGESADFTDFDINRTYPAGTIVRSRNNFFQAKLFVPSDIAVTDTRFWQRLPALPQKNAASVTLYLSSLTTPVRVDYGAEYDNIQQVYDFLIGLGRYQQSIGYDFGEYDSEIADIRDWAYAAKQFLFWSRGGWNPGNTLRLSPLANNIKFTAANGMISAIQDVDQGKFSLVDQLGRSIRANECEIIREDNTIEIAPPQGSEIFGITLYTQQIEHVMLVNNRTIFNDVIRQGNFDVRQTRLRIKGKRTRNWTGALKADGYVIQESELRPNLDTMAENISRYNETDFVPVESQLYEVSRRQYGYAERKYLRDLDIVDETQYSLYRGLIRNKGTTPSLEVIGRSSSVVQGNITVYDEWALKIADFGDVDNNQVLDIKLGKDDILSDPQLISVVYPEDITGVISRIDVIENTSRFFDAPILEIQPPTGVPAVQATGTVVLNSSGLIDRVAITNPGSGYTTAPAVNVITAQLITDSVTTTFNLAQAVSTDFVANSGVFTGGNVLSNITITDNTSSSTSIVDLANATNMQGVVDAINDEFTGANVTAGFNFNGENYLLVLSGTDFTVANSDVMLNMQDSRYQVKQRYSIETANNTTTADVTVTVAGQEVSSSFWDLDLGSRTQITVPTDVITGSISYQFVPLGLNGGSTDLIDANNLVRINNIYPHLDVFINNIKIDEGDFTLSGGNIAPAYSISDTGSQNIITFHDVDVLPGGELLSGDVITVIEKGTVTFNDTYTGDIPGNSLRIKVTANDVLAARTTLQKTFEITQDFQDDDVLTVDVDDITRVLRAPTDMATNGLWPMTSAVNHTGVLISSKPKLPNSGYVNSSNVDFQAFDFARMDSLFSTGRTPSSVPDELQHIHLAVGEMGDWQVVKLANTGVTQGRVVYDGAQTTAFLETEKSLFTEFAGNVSLLSDLTPAYVNGVFVLKNKLNITSNAVDDDGEILGSSTLPALDHSLVRAVNEVRLSSNEIKFSNVTYTTNPEITITSIAPERADRITHVIYYGDFDSRSATANTTGSGVVQITADTNLLYTGAYVTFTDLLSGNLNANSYQISNLTSTGFTVNDSTVSANVDSGNLSFVFHNQVKLTSRNDHGLTAGDTIKIVRGDYLNGFYDVAETVSNTEFVINTLYSEPSPTTFVGTNFDYVYSNSTVAAEPGNGSVRLSNADLTLADQIYIDNVDAAANDIAEYLDIWVNLSGNNLGTVHMVETADAGNVVSYTVHDVTDNSGYYTINCVYTSGTITNTADLTNVSMVFDRSAEWVNNQMIVQLEQPHELDANTTVGKSAAIHFAEPRYYNWGYSVTGLPSSNTIQLLGFAAGVETDVQDLANADVEPFISVDAYRTVEINGMKAASTLPLYNEREYFQEISRQIQKKTGAIDGVGSLRLSYLYNRRPNTGSVIGRMPFVTPSNTTGLRQANTLRYELDNLSDLSLFAASSGINVGRLQSLNNNSSTPASGTSSVRGDTAPNQRLIRNPVSQNAVPANPPISTGNVVEVPTFIVEGEGEQAPTPAQIAGKPVIDLTNFAQIVTDTQCELTPNTQRDKPEPVVTVPRTRQTSGCVLIEGVVPVFDPAIYEPNVVERCEARSGSIPRAGQLVEHFYTFAEKSGSAEILFNFPARSDPFRPRRIQVYQSNKPNGPWVKVTGTSNSTTLSSADKNKFLRSENNSVRSGIAGTANQLLDLVKANSEFVYRAGKVSWQHNAIRGKYYKISLDSISSRNTTFQYKICYPAVETPRERPITGVPVYAQPDNTQHQTPLAPFQGSMDTRALVSGSLSNAFSALPFTDGALANLDTEEFVRRSGGVSFRSPSFLRNKIHNFSASGLSGINPSVPIRLPQFSIGSYNLERINQMADQGITQYGSTYATPTDDLSRAGTVNFNRNPEFNITVKRSTPEGIHEPIGTSRVTLCPPKSTVKICGTRFLNPDDTFYINGEQIILSGDGSPDAIAADIRSQATTVIVNTTVGSDGEKCVIIRNKAGTPMTLRPGCKGGVLKEVLDFSLNRSVRVDRQVFQEQETDTLTGNPGDYQYVLPPTPTELALGDSNVSLLGSEQGVNYAVGDILRAVGGTPVANVRAAPISDINIVQPGSGYNPSTTQIIVGAPGEPGSGAVVDIANVTYDSAGGITNIPLISGGNDYNLSNPPTVVVKGSGTGFAGYAKPDANNSKLRPARFQVTGVDAETGAITNINVIDRGIYKVFPADLDRGVPLEYDVVDPCGDTELGTPGQTQGDGRGARIYMTSAEIPDCTQKSTALNDLDLPEGTVPIATLPETLSDAITLGAPRDERGNPIVFSAVRDINPDIQQVEVFTPEGDVIEFDDRATPGLLSLIGLDSGDVGPDLVAPTPEGTFIAEVEPEPRELSVYIPLPGVVGEGRSEVFQYELRRLLDNSPVTGSTAEQTVNVLALQNARFANVSDAGNVSNFSNVWIDNYENSGWAYLENGVIKAQQQPLVDVERIQDAFVADFETSNKLGDLYLWDPFKGVIPGFVGKNITYRGDNDPFVYATNKTQQGAEQVGQTWWDTSTMRYQWYEQGSRVYRRDNWGKLFPGSEIRVYEWIQSTVRPSEYAGPGVPKNATDFITNRVYDNARSSYITLYYFWVRDLPTLSDAAKQRWGRTLSTRTIQQVLANPLAQSSIMGIISDDSIILGNVGTLLKNEDSVLSVQLQRNRVDSAKKHASWLLISPDDADTVIPEKYSAKMIDSLCERDAENNPVPAPNLSDYRRLGISIRPRQTQFADPVEARRAMVECLNRTFAELTMNTLFPDWQSALTGTSTLSTVTWYAARGVDPVTKQIVRYDSTFKPLRKVRYFEELKTLTGLKTGNIVQVDEPGAVGYKLYLYDAAQDTFTLIAVENGTVQLSNSVYSTSWTDVQAAELRSLLTTLKDSVLTDGHRSYWNRLYFDMLYHTVAEQSQLNWAFKTSYLKVIKQETDLVPTKGFQIDNFPSAEEYFNEAKPYSSKIRSYFDVKSPPVEIFGSGTTDFDRPPYYDAQTNTVRILNADVAADANILNTDPQYSGYVSSNASIRTSNITIVLDRVKSALYENSNGAVLANSDPYVGYNPAAETLNVSIAKNIVNLNGISIEDVNNTSLQYDAADRLYKTNPTVSTLLTTAWENAYGSGAASNTTLTTNLEIVQGMVDSGNLNRVFSTISTLVRGDFQGNVLDAGTFDDFITGLDPASQIITGFGWDTTGWDTIGWDQDILVDNFEGIFNEQTQGPLEYSVDGKLIQGFDSNGFLKSLTGPGRPPELVVLDPLETLILTVTTSNIAAGDSEAVESGNAALRYSIDELGIAGDINISEFGSSNSTPVQYRVFYDVFGGATFQNFSLTPITTVNRRLNIWDSELRVADSSVLPLASKDNPVAIWLGSERLEYTFNDVTTNTLSGLARGTLGSTRSRTIVNGTGVYLATSDQDFVTLGIDTDKHVWFSTNDVGISDTSNAVVIQGTPVESGTEQVGSVLTASPATVSRALFASEPVTTWQWQRSSDGVSAWTDISGATNQTYTLSSTDESQYVRTVQTSTVTYGDQQYSDSAVSNITSPITPAPSGSPPPTGPFEMSVETTAPAETFTIPAQDIGTFNATIDWGDGNVSTVTAYNDANLTHTYATAGTHDISISGTFTNIHFNFGGDGSKVRTVTNLGTVGWESLEEAFAGCDGMTSFTAGVTDTSAVTSMLSMFDDCTAMTSIDLTGFDTSSVTTMRWMFYDCNSLTSLDVTGFDTSAVTDFRLMFYDCSSLTSLDVTGFNTSAATNFALMFFGCSSLTSLDLTGFDTSSATDISELVGNCSSLTSLDLSSFNTSSVTNMFGMFWGCTSLVTLNVSSFNTSSVTNMYGMFRECSSLTSLDVSGFNTSSVLFMAYMFRNCSSLTSLDVSGFNTSSVRSMFNMFENCSGLTDIRADVFDITGLDDLFDLDSFMTGVTLNTARYDAILIAWDAQTVFSGLRPDFGGSKYTPGGAAEAARSSLTNNDSWVITDGGANYVYGGDPFTMSVETTTASETFTIPAQDIGTFNANVDWGDGNVSTVTAYNDANLTHTYATAGTHDISISGVFPNIHFNNSGDKDKVRSVTNLGSVAWLTLEDAFQGCTGMTSFASGNCDTQYVTDMRNMFRDCSSLTSLDVTGFDTSSVTDMLGMFFNCSSLTSLDVTGFDTSSVTSMIGMFYDCSSLTSLDVTGFNTNAVTNMRLLFFNCSSLTSLDLTGFDTSSATDISELVGNCSSLTSLDLSNFDTSSVTNMAGIFWGCTSLATLDVSNFDTSSVTNMYSMFRECSSLNNFDISSFDTSSVLDMGDMFRGCSNITDVRVDLFDVSWFSSITHLDNFMTGVTLDTARYDATLIAWDAQTVRSGMRPDFGGSKYTPGGAAEAARTSLITNDSWIITDGGPA